MRIEKHKKKFRVVEGFWFWKKVFSVHPTRRNAEIWMERPKIMTEPPQHVLDKIREQLKE